MTLMLCWLPISDSLGFESILGQGEGLAGNVVLSTASPSVMTRVPTGSIRPGSWGIETGYSRQFDMAELDQYFFSAAYRRGWLSVAGSVTSLGQPELYSELTGKIMLAYHRDSLSIGLNASGQVLQFGGGYENLSAVGFGGGLSYRQKAYLFALTADNLNSPKFYEAALPSKALYSIYGEYRGRDSFSLLGFLKMTEGQAARIGLGQRIRVAKNGAIVWGISTKPSLYGAGFEMDVLGGRLAYSFSIHPTLGFSHVLSVMVGDLFGKFGGGKAFE